MTEQSPTSTILAGASDSGLHAALHPLVLLTISDYITRHALRGLSKPLVGALLGQQKGREITIEHAYDVRVLPPAQEGEDWKLDEVFFKDRLAQYKDVHKEPPLDLVGWWTVSPASGPSPQLLGIHKHILQTFNENSLVLAFHPEAAGKKALEQLSGSEAGSALPLTIFETVYEVPKGDADGDAIMQDDGQTKVEPALDIKLARLPYEMATGEAEMIAMDFVAKGSGNATAVETLETPASSKGKGKAKEADAAKPINQLNPQEEELISFLNTRANAIKMLQSRISQLKSYLHRLPQSYLTDPSSAPSQAEISHQTLRSIQALTSRLPHLLPQDTESYLTERSAESADVAVVSLLGALGRSTIDAKELGKVFHVADSARNAGRKGGKGVGGNGGNEDSFMGDLSGYGYSERGEFESLEMQRS